MALVAPVPLSPQHDCSAFDCDHAGLVEWLRRRARNNEAAQGSRCFVACEGKRVVGFYALAAGSVRRAAAPGAVRRNMPDPVPAIVLDRLAVDCAWQGQGLGADLLQDAVLRALRASREIGARVLLCHAVDERASHFYLHHGFVGSTFDPLVVMLDLKQVGSVLAR